MHKPTIQQLPPREPGAHGVTLVMREIAADHEASERPARERDRRLAGKARRRARRAEVSS